MARFLTIRSLGIAILAAMLFSGTAAASISLLGLKNSLVQFALDQISVPGELEITAESVEEPEDGSTALVGVTVADRDGIWLRVESLSVNWNASRILRGELDIADLAATGVEVLRQPVSAAVEVKEDAEIAQTDDDLFDWPRSPLTLRIGQLRLERVSIASGVIATQSLAFDATGSLVDEGDEQSLKFDLTRTDAVEGAILLNYVRRFEANSLDLTIRANEAAGGLVGELAGFPEDSGSRLELVAEGPLTNWKFNLSAEAETVYEIAGEGFFSNHDRLSAALGLVVTPGEAAPAEIRSVLEPAARLSLRVAEGEDQIVRIEQGTLSSPELTMSASGTYDRSTGDADLSLSLEGQSGLADLVDGVDFNRFGFNGSVTGPGSDLTASGVLSLDGLRTAPVDLSRARLGTDVQITGGRIAFDVGGETEGLRLDKIAAETLGTSQLSAIGVWDQGVLELQSLSLTNGVLALTADGRVDTNAEALDARYALKAPRLGPLAEAYAVNAAGGLDISGDAKGPFSALALSGTARLEDMRFEGESYGVVALSHAVTLGETIGGEIDLTASGSRFGPADIAARFSLADEVLDLAALEASALDVRITGTAEVDLAGTLATGRVSLAADDLSTLGTAIEQPLAGRLDGTVTLAPVEKRQQAEIALSLTDFEGFEATLARADITGLVSDALGDPAADLKLVLREAAHPQGGVGDAEVTARLSQLTTAPAVEADFSLQEISAPGGASIRAVTGTASAQNLTAAPEGRVTLSAERVAAPGALLPRATLEAELTGQGAEAQATARLRAPSLQAEGATVQALAADLRVSDPLGTTPSVDLRSSTGSISAGEVQIEGVNTTVKGPLSALAVAFDTRGGMLGEDPLSASLRAQANVAEPVIRVRVDRADLGYKTEQVTLGQPLNITVDGGTTRLQGLDLQLLGGALTGDAALHPSGLSGALVASIPDLARVNGLAETPISSGRLDLDAAFDTRAGRAKADVTVNATDLVFDSAVNELADLDLTATLDWDGRLARARASLSGPFDNPLELTAETGLRPSSGPVPVVPDQSPLKGALRWDGDIGEFWALVPVPDHVLDGRLKLDLSVEGTVAAPRLGGEVALNDGEYQNLDTGTILTDLEVGSTVDPSGALELELMGSDGGSGQVTATVRVDAETVDLKLNANQAVLVRRDDVGAQLTIDLDVAGPLAGPDVKGVITVDRAEVRLVNQTPPSVVVLDDVRIKGEPAPEEPEPGPGEDIALDIRVDAPRNVFVRGRGLDSEWLIDLDVKGTAAVPLITGRVERIRGGLDLIGREFDLETGLVTFSGGRKIDPNLDVTLAHENNDGLIGRINVTGRASAPEIGFSSDPALPESEVLPRTIFGRSQQSLSPIEAVQLANALATLLDGSGGTLDRVRAVAGVDVLRIEQQGDSVAVAAGKNVSEDVFVGVKQPIGGGAASVEVEVEVFDGVSVDAEVGQDEGSSLGLNWRYDF